MTKSSPKQSKRFEERQALIARAAAGDASAQLQMGDLCREGDGLTAQDLTESARWYRLAAEQGNDEAQNNLGAMCQHGMGVPADMVEAAKWYRLAAAQNVPVAKFNLGVLLRQGLGVDANPVEGLRLMQEAADADYVVAASELGEMFRVGDGVAIDLAQSAEYLIKAARRGDGTARQKLREMAQPLGELAMSGNSSAAWSLKEMYESGLGVPRSLKECRRWGMLCATIRNNQGEPRGFTEVLTVEGNLESPQYDDFVKRATGDDRYSLEWLYNRSAEGRSVYIEDREALVAYRTKRDAGMPPPSASAWPDDDWRKWETASSSAAPSRPRRAPR